MSDPSAGALLLAGAAVLALLVVWQDRPPWLLPALLAVVVLGTYLRTLLPSVGEADAMEFQVVATRLGVAHPTGYPLYILLSKLFTFLPVSNVAWRVNLASATFATAAVVMLYVIVRDLSDRPLVALLTALGFAFSNIFWSQALIAEVYTLHNLFVVVLFWLFLCRTGREAGGDRRSARPWQAALFLVGLSLTNHLTTLLLLPSIGLALLWDKPQLGAKEWLVGAGLLLLGFSVYVYIPLRWPALHDGRWMTIGEFFTYISGGQFHDALRLDGWQDPTRWRIVGRLLQEPFGWIGLLAGMLGVVDLAARDRRALLLTGVPFLAYLVYGLCYYVDDIAVFLLPAHLILALWIGLGAVLTGRLLSSVRSLPSVAWRSGLVTVLALLPLSRIWINLPRVDRSGDREGYAWGRYVLDQPLAEDSAILADTKKFAPLYYLQQVEGVRSDIDMVLLGTEELYQADLRHRLGQGQTVYLARYLPHVEEFYLQSVGPLVEVRNQVARGSAAENTVVASFGDGIQLLSAQANEDPLARAIYHVELRWRIEAPVHEDLAVRLRLVDADDQVQWTNEGARPVNGLYPTNAWAVGVPVSDYYEVPIRPWLPPGAYSLEVGLFIPFGGGVPVDGQASPWLKVHRLNVETPSTPDPLPHRQSYRLGDDTWLTGFDAPGSLLADSPMTVDLGWHGLAGEGERLRLQWMDAEDRPVETIVQPLSAGVVRSRHVVTTPHDPGTYRLDVGLVDGAARCGWLASPGDLCPLIEVEVLADREGLADFATRILLVNAEVGKTTVNPGDTVPVTLRWRAMRPVDADYTVFVHLMGPDGRLYGQIDRWPVHGSFPTSEWSPGREIIDRYDVRLDAHAPAGEYRVQVGWYLLETMQRLQVLGKRGEPIADSFVAGTFSVPE